MTYNINLFVNRLLVAILKLNSEFKQAVQNIITRYKKMYLPKYISTNKLESLLDFKHGALVCFSACQYDVFMVTKLDGDLQCQTG